MPFRLSNAAQSFQSFIDQVMRDLPFVNAYKDVLRIVSKDESEHLTQEDKRVWVNNRSWQVWVWETTSQLFRSRTRLTRYQTSSRGNTSHQKLSYIQLVPKGFDIARPLTDLLRGRANSLLITPQAIQAFEQLKSPLSIEALLVRRKIDTLFSVMTNVSNVTAGAVLQQRVNQQWKRLAFFAKS